MNNEFDIKIKNLEEKRVLLDKKLKILKRCIKKTRKDIEINFLIIKNLKKLKIKEQLQI